jgi:hypothetical protein
LFLFKKISCAVPKGINVLKERIRFDVVLESIATGDKKKESATYNLYSGSSDNFYTSIRIGAILRPPIGILEGLSFIDFSFSIKGNFNDAINYLEEIVNERGFFIANKEQLIKKQNEKNN